MMMMALTKMKRILFRSIPVEGWRRGGGRGMEGRRKRDGGGEEEERWRRGGGRERRK